MFAEQPYPVKDLRKFLHISHELVKGAPELGGDQSDESPAEIARIAQKMLSFQRFRGECHTPGEY